MMVTVTVGHTQFMWTYCILCCAMLREMHIVFVDLQQLKNQEKLTGL